MQSFTRYLGLALIPLLVFLAVTVTGQAWFERETRRLQADAIAARQAQLAQALTITHRAPETWDEPFLRDLGALLGGTVTLVRRSGMDILPSSESTAQGGTGQLPAPEGSPKPTGGTPGPRSLLAFDYPFPGAAGLHARVTFPAPAANRLIVLHERMFAAVVLLAFVLIVVSALLPLCYQPARETDSPGRWPNIRSEVLGMEHFARISVEHSEALKRETGARHQAEENLQVSRTLLDRSVQARVQLGRDLHDNICQTLYAVSLSLEAVRRMVVGEGANPTGARLDQCIAELRRLNHEVRSYLKDLEPDAVRREPFTAAIAAMLNSQSQVGGPKFVQDLEPEATDLIAPEQTAEVISILREAVSNSVRHGRAQTITLQARRNDECVVLAVRDDGRGFDLVAAGGEGHGLANMPARAAAIGGSLKITSAPGKGTRVLLTLPVSSG
jgi:signal transduction histidine kinase